jgi:hypothetical protein
VGTPYIWYGLRVSAKGLSKGTPDFEYGPKLLTLFKADPYSESFDTSQAGPASWKKGRTTLFFDHLLVIEPKISTGQVLHITGLGPVDPDPFELIGGFRIICNHHPALLTATAYFLLFS